MEISIKWNVCRICMEEESKSVILRPIFNEPTLPNDIFLCSGIELKKTDNFPDKICQRCISILKYAIKFRVTCQKTTEYLKDIVQKTQTASNIFKSNKSNTSTEAEVTFENIDFLEEEQQTVGTDVLIAEGHDGSQIIGSNDVQYVIQDVESAPSSAEQSPIKIVCEDEIPNTDNVTIEEDSQVTTEFPPDCSDSVKGSEVDQYEQDYELAYFSEDDIKQEIYEIPEEEESHSVCDNESNSQINDYTQGGSNESPIPVIKDEDLKPFPRKYAQRAKPEKDYDFICDICGNHFKKKCLLSFHMKIHRNEKNYQCEICNKRFNSPCNLRSHIRTHTGEKPFHCKYCDRKFADRSTQIKHERIHTNEKPYSCSTCGKCFSLTTSLKAHEKMHTGERPYKCEPCSKAFTLPHQLKAHLQTNMHRVVSEL